MTDEPCHWYLNYACDNFRKHTEGFSFIHFMCKKYIPIFDTKQTNKQTKTSWTQSIKLHFKWFCHCVSVVYLKATEGGRCGSVIHLRPSTLAGERGSFIFWEPKRRNLWHLFLRTAHLASFSFSRVRSAKCMVPTQSSGWGMPSQDEAITDQ